MLGSAKEGQSRWLWARSSARDPVAIEPEGLEAVEPPGEDVKGGPRAWMLRPDQPPLCLPFPLEVAPAPSPVLPRGVSALEDL